MTELDVALFGRRRHHALMIAGDVLTVLVCWGVGLTLIGIGLEDTPGLRSDVWIALDLLLGLVGVPLLFLRRRFPLLVAVLLVVFSSVSMGVALASGVALFALAVRRRWQVAVPVAVASVGLGTIQLFVWPDPAFSWWVGLLGQVLVLTGVLAWGMYARARRQLSATWREAAERARAEQELRAEQARSVERARIAREMHDVLAHRISLVSMHAGALEMRLESSPDPDVVTSAATIRRSARAALEDLRDILGVLRDESAQGSTEPQPGLDDVPQLVAEVVELGVPVDLRITVSDVPEVLGRTVYRVVQEGLTNVRKHAPGHAVTVCVDGRRGRRLQVAVTNRPGGFDAVAVDAPSSGYGLVGLRERLDLVGGTVRTRRVGQGFELSARIPWPRRS